MAGACTKLFLRLKTLYDGNFLLLFCFFSSPFVCDKHEEKTAKGSRASCAQRHQNIAHCQWQTSSVYQSLNSHKKLPKSQFFIIFSAINSAFSSIIFRSSRIISSPPPAASSPALLDNHRQSNAESRAATVKSILMSSRKRANCFYMSGNSKQRSLEENPFGGNFFATLQPSASSSAEPDVVMMMLIALIEWRGWR
jgi:hypothetical protein